MTDNDHDLDRPIWGAKAIAEAAERSVPATFKLLESGQLPAKKVGNRWVSTKRRIRDSLVGEVA